MKSRQRLDLEEEYIRVAHALEKAWNEPLTPRSEFNKLFESPDDEIVKGMENLRQMLRGESIEWWLFKFPVWMLLALVALFVVLGTAGILLFGIRQFL